MGLVAPRHVDVGTPRTRARTRVPCIGRWILNHCATREVLNCFSKWLHHSAVPLAVMEDSNSSTFWPRFFFFYYSHSSKCEVFLLLLFFFVVLNCIFLMTECSSFHVFIGHLFIFFGEMSIQVLWSFLIGLFVLCCVSVRLSLVHLSL